MSSTIPGPSSTDDQSIPNLEYTNNELGQMMMDMNTRFANQDKKMMSHQFELESFARRQDMMNRKIEDTLSRLVEASLSRKPPDPGPAPDATRGWKLPPSIIQPPNDVETDKPPRLQLTPPRFNGDNATDWIRKIQKYYNHHFTPLDDRMYLTTFLFDHPASDWMSYWEDNNKNKTWDDFLLAVKTRFDPDLYVDYIGRLASLQQTSSLDSYQAAFETTLQKISHIDDDTVMSLFINGLQPYLKEELLTRWPRTLHDAFAMAQRVTACHIAAAAHSNTQRTGWTPREPRPTPMTTQTSRTSDPPKAVIQRSSRDTSAPRDYPVVRVSAAERAERTKKGLCWYCDDAYSRTHVCSKRFYALMGTDEDEDITNQEDEDTFDEDGENMVITGDVSSIHVISPKIRPRAIRLQGSINGSKVSVLIDGGSTHNFIKPDVAEQLSLSVHTIKPFRVFVGNGESLRCSYACLDTPITLQGHSFALDLFILKVKGPDVILGVQWLQELGDVTKNYRNLTMRFDWGDHQVRLQGEDHVPQQIAYNALFSLLAHETDCDLFEIVPSCEKHDDPANTADGPDTTAPSHAGLTQPDIRSVLGEFQPVFSVPKGLPPPRRWDHRVHLIPPAKPVNVRPYRYPYFQKTEIERQIKDMLDQGVIQHSTSPFSSPVLLVRKKDGSFRFCVDYRALNAATTPDHFPIPTADELFDELHVARIFSKLDLRSGYHQIRMAVNDVHKTAFRTHDGHFEFLVMPFGLTNAPSTFQAAMNSIFRPLLRKSVIVFFDDILVYSKSSQEHCLHLRQVLQILADNSFFIKLSKCSFAVEKIEYLGHIISNGGLSADPSKIEAMVAWPTPKTVKQLRGFLGLTGYYRRFMEHYSILAAPLTELLKKESFKWSATADDSFSALKRAMTSTPVLRLPNFDLPFVIETDASDFGIGAVLLQDKHPIAYFSKKLGPKRRLSSTYHKELYAIVEAVQKWRQYLLGHEFIIRSDQRSLKELLDQIVQTPDQQFYIRKLMGFKFTIEYKSGASNRVADALSRREDDGDTAELQVFTLAARPLPTLMDTVSAENQSFPELTELHSAVAAGTAPAHISVHAGILHYKTRILIARDSAVKRDILSEFHDTHSAGHPGVRRTFARIAATFYWRDMRKDIKDYVAACATCQATKYVALKPAGLIQPLPIPDLVWEAASMDFIVGLPPSQGFTAVMVVVDRLSKYAHFGALKSGFDATKVACLFVDKVVKLHGFPDKLLSDRDSIFLSELWTELLALSGTKLQFTTAYHPQTDGQTEVTNRALEQYLRAFTFDQPARWSQLLPWAELALNCSFNSSIGMSPFEALYGRTPPSVFATPARPARNIAARELLRERTETMGRLKRNIARSQVAMADSANRHRREVQYNVGDRVWLRLQPYRQHSVGRPISEKLGRRFYGPYEIAEQIGAVAYRLILPADSRIHDVFHVSLLKPFVPPFDDGRSTVLPTVFRRSNPVDVPIRASEERTVLINDLPQIQWLVHWASDPDSHPSWEPVEEIQRHFPSLHLEDKAAAMGEGVDREPDGAAGPTVPTTTEELNHDDSCRESDKEDDGADSQNLGPASLARDRPRRIIKRPDKYKDFSSR